MAGHPLLLYGHRGAPAERPENTAPSFELALELGVDALETDVHLTRDGQVVVAHDEDGRRMASVPRSIRDSTLADLRTWDTGWGYTDARGDRPFTGRGIAPLRLEELLELAPDVRLNIDLKADDPRLVNRTIDVLHDARAEDRTLLASFHSEALRLVRGRWRGRTGMSRNEMARLVFMPTPMLRMLGAPGDAAQVPVAYSGVRFDTRRFIDKCHDVGMRVDFWTINDPYTARRLLDLGADGIMTDDPRAIAPVFETRRSAAA